MARRMAGPPGGERKPSPPGSKAASMDGTPLVVVGGMLFLLFVCGFVYYLALQPEITEDISGFHPTSGTKSPNLMSLLAVGLSSGKDLAITEGDINRYLAATVRAKQNGPTVGNPEFRGIAVRLEDGHIEVLVERTLFGRKHTMATHFVLVQKNEGGERLWSLDTDGGKFGRLPVNGLFLRLGWRPLVKLAHAYDQELRILRHASSLRIEEGRVLLGRMELDKR